MEVRVESQGQETVPKSPFHVHHTVIQTDLPHRPGSKPAAQQGGRVDGGGSESERERHTHK